MVRSVVLAMLFLAAPGVLPARASDSLHGRVVGMLSAIESFPEHEEWRRLGSEAVAVLIAIADDARQPTFRRARALIALGSFDDATAMNALEHVVSDDASGAALRRHAMLGLGRAALDRALPHLARALDSDDVAMRQTAIKALSATTSPRARGLLRERLQHERRPLLIQQIGAALADGD